MVAMFRLFQSMPLRVIFRLHQLMHGRQPRLTADDISNRLRAIAVLAELMPKPETCEEQHWNNIVVAWLLEQIEALHAQARLIQANVLYVGTVPLAHNPGITKEN